MLSCVIRSYVGADRDTADTSRDIAKTKEALERLVETLMKPEHVEKRYEIQGFIGKGGFGVVSKVRDLATGALYAMKKLPFDSEGKSNDNIIREIFNIIKMRKKCFLL